MNNNSIALNILYVPHNTEKIRHAYKSKHNLKCKNQVSLLMITGSGEKWHYLAVKSLSALLRGITSKHDRDCYCLNCFRAYTTENRLKEHKNVCESHNYCYLKMPEEDNKMLKYNQGKKLIRKPFVSYGDLEWLFEKMRTCRNNPEKSLTIKINKLIFSGYSLFTCSSFDTVENNLDFYRSENCMKKFSKDLRKHLTRIISYEDKETMPLTIEERKTHR